MIAIPVLLATIATGVISAEVAPTHRLSAATVIVTVILFLPTTVAAVVVITF
jgi:hypothetical protein